MRPMCKLLAACAALVLSLASAETATAAPSVLDALACACFEGSELKIDGDRSLRPDQCDCAYAKTIRADLKDALTSVPGGESGDRQAIALALETGFITRSPEYEELFRYDRGRYRWFLENVRCVCDGCKATVYFSNCQLGCTPSVRYKRRARIWLALGFSTDQLIDYYLAEHNAGQSDREQADREWLLPRREKKRGWMVPAIVICGAILLLGSLLWRVAQRRRRRDEVEAEARAEEPGSGPEISAEERDMLLDDLDDLEQDGGW